MGYGRKGISKFLHMTDLLEWVLKYRRLSALFPNCQLGEVLDLVNQIDDVVSVQILGFSSLKSP